MSNIFRLINIFFIVSIQSWISCDEFDDPDTYLYTDQIIERYNFPSETHFVLTEDCYNITVFRIPDPDGQPILMEHGFIFDSSMWVLQEHDSLAFLFAQEGYDVWLSNYRGTNYSEQHCNYTTKQSEFWNWGWEEMGKYDTTAVLKHIVNTTGKMGEIIYVGYSMANIVFFSLMSSQPEYYRYVKAMFALAPAAYPGTLRGPLAIYARFVESIKEFYRLAGRGPFPYINDPETEHGLLKSFCRVNKEICKYAVMFLTGFDPEFSYKMLARLIGHFPSATSAWRTGLHLAQQITYNKFQRFDYSPIENLIKYNSTRPPEYDLRKINVTISMYWGQNDWLSTGPDVRRIWSEIPYKYVFHVIPLPTWTHLNFVYQPRAKQLLYDRVVSDVNKFRT